MATATQIDTARLREELRLAEKGERRARKAGNESEADAEGREAERLRRELAAATFDVPRDKAGRLNPGAAKAKAAADAARTKARTEAAEKANKPALTDAQESRRKVRDRKRLDEYIRANGNMSAGRRKAVIVPALTNLGYDPGSAQRIAIDAPLNASMYNDQAVMEALRYADSITPERIAANDDVIRGAITPGAIAMPERAREALAQPVPMPPKAKKALQRDRAVAMRYRMTQLRRIAGNVSDLISPLADRLGNAPVYGGLGGMFLINLGFLFFVVPANAQGYTRSQLLYGLLLNRVRWKGGFEPPPKPPVQDNALFVDARAAAQGVADIAQDIDQIAGGAASVAHGASGALGAGIAGALQGALGAVGGGPVGGSTGTGTGPPRVNTDFGPRRPPASSF